MTLTEGICLGLDIASRLRGILTQERRFGGRRLLSIGCLSYLDTSDVSLLEPPVVTGSQGVQNDSVKPISVDTDTDAKMVQPQEEAQNRVQIHSDRIDEVKVNEKYSEKYNEKDADMEIMAVKARDEFQCPLHPIAIQKVSAACGVVSSSLELCDVM